jgi:DNA-3-methyladenine glycosylase
VLQLPVLEVAPRLLGAVIATGQGARRVAVALTEVEAYDGANDPASHAYNGRTPRNRPMFQAGGVLYVYRSYGIHWCMNVVTGPEGAASAVLLRGGVLMDGNDLAIERRGRRDHLVDGPGKLCQALGVTGDVSGTEIGDHLAVSLSAAIRHENISATPRIGISKAQDRKWRFVSTDSGEPSGSPS